MPAAAPVQLVLLSDSRDFHREGWRERIRGGGDGQRSAGDGVRSGEAGPDREGALDRLQGLAGVGEAAARDLWQLGVRSPSDLADRNPEALYEELCSLQGGYVDRCMLYVLRCAIYHASTPEPDPELLRWWRWKDDGEPRR